MTRAEAYDVVVLDPALSSAAAPLIASLLAVRPDLGSRLVVLAADADAVDPATAGVPRLAKPVVPREARALIRSLLGRRAS